MFQYRIKKTHQGSVNVDSKDDSSDKREKKEDQSGDLPRDFESISYKRQNGTRRPQEGKNEVNNRPATTTKVFKVSCSKEFQE